MSDSVTWFEKLKNLVDIDISIANKNIIINKGQEEPISLSDDGESVNIDIDKIKESAGEDKAHELIRQVKDEEENIWREDTEKDVESVKNSRSSEEIRDALDFFKKVISEKHLKALEASLYMREAWQKREEHVESRKEDIIEKFGDEGRRISNLCSAGYFDEGGYLRELYQRMSQSEGYKEGDFRKKFNEIVMNEPFSVFVSHSEPESNILSKVKQKLRKYKKYGVRVDFVDVRGIGEYNVEKIENVMNKLDNELESIKYTELEDDKEYMTAKRIYPRSVKGLN